MQHLGEICMAQRSRDKDKQDKRRVKARKGFSNRRFERRFWVLLPPGAKVPRAGARNAPTHEQRGFGHKKAGVMSKGASYPPAEGR